MGDVEFLEMVQCLLVDRLCRSHVLIPLPLKRKPTSPGQGTSSSMLLIDIESKSTAWQLPTDISWGIIFANEKICADSMIIACLVPRMLA